MFNEGMWEWINFNIYKCLFWSRTASQVIKINLIVLIYYNEISQLFGIVKGQNFIVSPLNYF